MERPSTAQLKAMGRRSTARAALLWLSLLAELACPLTPKGARAAGVKARGNSRTKRAKSAAPPVSAASFKSKESGLAPDVIGALDFECTCEPGWDYIHEIIEFPVVLFDTRTREITDSFHSYVRPTENATLSAFCTDLTGIEQATVDAAPTLPEVLDDLDAWLRARGLVGAEPAASFALATDGWDLEHFLDVELSRKLLYKPGDYLDRWVDLSKAFDLRRAARDVENGRKKGRSRRRSNLNTMLRHHKMEFEGRLHSGIDDATNLARVGIALLEAREDWPLRVNDALPGASLLGESDDESPQ